jgi:hypothetical protein
MKQVSGVLHCRLVNWCAGVRSEGNKTEVWATNEEDTPW